MPRWRTSRSGSSCRLTVSRTGGPTSRRSGYWHEPAALASAYALRASQLTFAGQTRAAFGWIEEALTYSRQARSPDLHFWIEMTAADLATQNGQIEEGVRLFEAAVQSARELDNPRR